MQYEDTRTIATPEGVELRLALAGLGSRFMALLIDVLIQTIVLVALLVLAAYALGGLAATIVQIVGTFAAVLVYPVLFEVYAGGRTPGKRAAGLRVVRDGGGPVGLGASLVRNVFRLLEGIPTFYVPAMISVLVTADNQRLGDLAAGTLVVREPRKAPAVPPPLVDPGRYASWDVTGIGTDELNAVRGFLARREQLHPSARRALAADLARQLRARVAGAPAGIPDEPFLEALSAAKASRR
jgi:uncharacterized RDD family membrane protein YckC